MPLPLSADAQAIRDIIEHFIAERRDAKQEKLSPDDEKYQQLTEQFEREAWLEDAARRVGQLQVVTHVLKGIHPDAKGTNLFVQPEQLPASNAVGSYACPSLFSDVTGNAAALDIYKFLKLEYQGSTLLDRFTQHCDAATAALSDTPALSEEWAAAFAGITKAKNAPASHVCAKQMYWLKGGNASCNDDYVLLAPLFPSSLVHEVFQKIQHDRFSEEAKEARKARHDNKPANSEVHHYPEFAIRKLGGTKPQNISQLNSERGGSNILLSSLPPQWDTTKLTPILNTPTAMRQLRRHNDFYKPLYSLRNFLHTAPAPNIATRTKVRRLIAEIIDGVISFTMKIHNLPAGWTAINETQEDGTIKCCDLPDYEQHWLDPFRTAQDTTFRQQRAISSWQDKLHENIAREINKTLNWGNKAIGVGDTEINEWERSAQQHAAMRSLNTIDMDYMAELDRQLGEAIAFMDDEEEYSA